MKLISHHLCPYVQRAVIVLLEKNIPHERIYIDLSNKPDWFLEVSPLGRVPLLQTADTVLFESQVIVEYLDEISKGTLHPSDPLERARHRSWIEYGSTTLNVIARLYNAPDKKYFMEALDDLGKRFEVMEAEIEGPFFAGSKLHIIDAAWGPIFRYFNVLDPLLEGKIFAGLVKVMTWRRKLAARQSVIDAVPEGYETRLKLFLKNRDGYIAGQL